MRYLIAVAFIAVPLLAAAQTPSFASYNWQTFPAVPVPDTVKAPNGVLQALDRRITEVYPNEQGNFEEIQVNHVMVKVGTHEAINQHNKIFIGLNDVIDIVDIKARFISPSGKITELPKESIRQLENLENKGNYKTFAIEGAEVGGTVEYYYILKKKFDAFGSFWAQGKDAKANVDVIYEFPSTVEYKIKSYNGFADFVKTTPAEGKTRLRAQMAYVPALANEKYAFYEANLMRYEATMAYNTKRSITRFFSWEKAAAWYYNTFNDLTKAETKAVKSLTKKIDNPALPTEARIRQLENWLKANFVISDEVPTLGLDQAIAHKQCRSSQAAKLFYHVFGTAGIPMQVVATSNRQRRPFDYLFSCWNYLDETLLYFPELNKALKPDDNHSRLGVLPSEFLGAHGLFLSPVKIDDKTSSFGYDIAQLPTERYTDNIDTLLINVTVDVSNLSLNAKISRAFYGQTAANFQGFWGLINKDRQDAITQDMFDMGTNNVQVNSYEVKNRDAYLIGQKPFLWDVDVTSNALVEMAGNDLIVRIGETIGEQSELYNVGPRVLPIQIDVLRGYYRKIKFTVPPGYQIANLSDLTMNVEMRNRGEVSCAFTADYQLQGNTLTIVSHEFYGEEYYPKERFEEFRQVINAAADFNKKTLVLKKM